MIALYRLCPTCCLVKKIPTITDHHVLVKLLNFTSFSRAFSSGISPWHYRCEEGELAKECWPPSRTRPGGWGPTHHPKKNDFLKNLLSFKKRTPDSFARSPIVWISIHDSILKFTYDLILYDLCPSWVHQLRYHCGSLCDFMCDSLESSGTHWVLESELFEKQTFSKNNRRSAKKKQTPSDRIQKTNS